MNRDHRQAGEERMRAELPRGQMHGQTPGLLVVPELVDAPGPEADEDEVYNLPHTD